MSDMDSLFLRIIAREVPADVVRENERVIAIRDINPQAPTHVLVVPKKRYRNAAELAAADPQLLAELVTVAHEIAEAEGIAESGYRLLFNTNEDAGQTIFHVHLHLLGGERIQHQRAHLLHVPGRGLGDLAVAVLGELGDRAAPVAVRAHPPHPAALLQPRHHVREPGRRGRGARGEVAHPQRAGGFLAEHHEHEVAEVRQVGVPLQLGVQRAGQQHRDHREGAPGPLLVVVQPPRLAHSPSLTGAVEPLRTLPYRVI